MSNGWAPPSLTLQASDRKRCPVRARSVSNGWAPPSLTLRASDWTALSIRARSVSNGWVPPSLTLQASTSSQLSRPKACFMMFFLPGLSRISNTNAIVRIRSCIACRKTSPGLRGSRSITVGPRVRSCPIPSAPRIRATPSPVSARLFGAGRGSTGPTWRARVVVAATGRGTRVFDVGFRVVCGVEEPRKNLPQRSCILSRAGAWVPGLDRRGGPGNLSKE